MTKLWGGRFSKETDKSVEKFTKSIQFDYKLAKYDVLGSMAHVRVLQKSDFLTKDEAQKLWNGLHEIYESISNKTFQSDDTCEDIHTDIQKKLEKEVGDLVLKLHTARSRNDQVVVATKMYCKDKILEIQKYLKALTVAIDELLEKNRDIIIPGFTHLQHAQPVYLKDYLLAYSSMLARDFERLDYISDNMNITQDSVNCRATTT